MIIARINSFFNRLGVWKWPSIAISILISAVIFYVLDVWLIGSLSSYLVTVFKVTFKGMNQETANSILNWYLYHPLATARAWLGPGKNLTNPEIRAGWFILNILVIILVPGIIINARLANRNIDSRDIKQVRFKKLRFNPNRQLAKTSQNKYFLALDDQRKAITLPADKMTEHIHILGGSGSGKTSLAVIPLCIQAIRRGTAVIAIDFKGDKQAIHLLAREARAAGKRFYFFSVSTKIKSNTYNPMVLGSVLSKVERVMTALELVYTGEAKFYSYVQQSTFIPLLKALDAMGTKYTLADIHTILKNPKLFKKLTGEEISEDQIKGLTSALTPYADLTQINDPWSDINLAEVTQKGDVCYFDLRSAEAPQLSSALGKMIAMDLQALAADRNQLDRLAVVAIDEFQNMACSAFTNVISKVRSANYGLILANQAMGDLRAVSQDFLNTVITNTATKMVFNVEEPEDVEYFARRSGKDLQEVSSRSKSRQIPNLAELINGKHKRDNVSESKSKTETYFIHPNIVSQLPFGKSIIFRRGELAALGNHAHLISKAEKDRLEGARYPEPEPHREEHSGNTVADYINKVKHELSAGKSQPKPSQKQGKKSNAGNVQSDEVAL